MKSSGSKFAVFSCDEDGESSCERAPMAAPQKHLSAEAVKSTWEKKCGFYLLVKKDNGRGTLYAKTKSAETAANLLKFGFLGTGDLLYTKLKMMAEY